MHAGTDARSGAGPLTELAGGEAGGLARTASIIDFDISPDGTQVAFTSKRTQFPLGFPAYVSAPAAEPGMNELFDADLGDDTLTRVTQGFEGGPSQHPHIPRPAGQDPYEENGDGALSPSFSADGDVLAFSSTASNLVWATATRPRSNRPANPAASTAPTRSSSNAACSARCPPRLHLAAPWSAGDRAGMGPERYGALAPDGSVLLYVEVPGAERCAPARMSAVLVATGPATRSRAARGAHGRSGRASRAGRKSAGPRQTVADRGVATASVPSRSAEPLTLTLRLAQPYAALASRHGGLSATVRLVFVAAAGRPVLRQSIPVSFVRIAHAARRAKSAHRGGGDEAAGRTPDVRAHGGTSTARAHDRVGPLGGARARGCPLADAAAQPPAKRRGGWNSRCHPRPPGAPGSESQSRSGSAGSATSSSGRPTAGC